MPIMRCSKNGKPGWKWGKNGKCYTYSKGSKKGSRSARQKAHLQKAAALKAGFKES